MVGGKPIAQALGMGQPTEAEQGETFPQWDYSN
jgi:hypothetical protein